jgi:hypothetical protein
MSLRKPAASAMNEAAEAAQGHAGPGRSDPVLLAICTFADGEQVPLPITALSCASAFVLSMRPPALQSWVTLTIHSPGRDPIGPLRARVIGARIDPWDPLRTGFEVAFPLLSEQDVERLIAIAVAPAAFGAGSSPLDPPRRPERRACPRVRTQRAAQLLHDGQVVRARLSDISMSGAKVELESAVLPPCLACGAEVMLHIASEQDSEAVEVKAVVVWLSGDSARLVGVRFEELDSPTSRDLETFILEELISSRCKRPQE